MLNSQEHRIKIERLLKQLEQVVDGDNKSEDNDDGQNAHCTGEAAGGSAAAQRSGVGDDDETGRAQVNSKGVPTGQNLSRPSPKYMYLCAMYLRPWLEIALPMTSVPCRPVLSSFSTSNLANSDPQDTRKYPAVGREQIYSSLQL